jgi:MoxR-like ATPase
MTARLEMSLESRDSLTTPAAAPAPEQLKITILTDKPEAVEPLKLNLILSGFSHIQIEKEKSVLEDPVASLLQQGFLIHWGAAGRDPEIARRIQRQVKAARRRLGAGPSLPLLISPTFADDDRDVLILFPVEGVADGRLLGLLAAPERYRVRLVSPEPADWADVEAELKSWGFAGIEAVRCKVRRHGRIEFGRAPISLVERLRGLLSKHLGAAPVSRRLRDELDRTVEIRLPRRPQPCGTPVVALVKPAVPEGVNRSAAFLETSAEQVRVGRIVLPRRAARGEPFVPAPELFALFCIDELTAATLHHVAVSVLLREPCLVEGETSTSKTSSILYLASLLGQPAVRINLNGQTDTGELIGRYVPRESEGGHAGATWRWQDGLVVQAMKHGWWVLLDEVNLAEPQILERLNSVLEQDPSLVLTEHDNSRLGRGAMPVHPDFRLFATMNPAEYSGRSVLSPAYRDRWSGYRYVARPGECEYLAMLRLLVHGEQPEVEVRGRRYLGGRQPARYPALAGALSDDMLRGLARFQVALEHAAGQVEGGTAKLGARRKERQVFTRRGLLSMLQYLASPLGVGAGATEVAFHEALVRYYLDRVAFSEDRTVVLQLLDAAGIGARKEKENQ